MKSLKYENVVSVLLEEISEIPIELKNKNKEYLKLPTLYFSFVLTPYLNDLLKSGEKITEIKKVFNFLEELTLQDDKNIKSLVAVPIMEDLDHDGLKQKAREYMGPNTESISFAPHGWIV